MNTFHQHQTPQPIGDLRSIELSEASFSPDPSLAPGETIHLEQDSLVLLVGGPGSGKSTFAINHFPNEAIVSLDRIRQELTNNPENQLCKPFEIAKAIVESRMLAGQLTVIDATNTTTLAREDFSTLAQANDRPVVALGFDIKREELQQRVENRGRGTVGSTDQFYYTTQAGLRQMTYDQTCDEHYILSEVTANQINIVHGLDTNSNDTAALPENELAGYQPQWCNNPSSPLRITPGSVLALESNVPEALRETGLLPHQIVDVAAIARRCATEVDSPVVLKICKEVLLNRSRLNLTTGLQVPVGWTHTPALELALSELEQQRSIKVPLNFTSEEEIAHYPLHVERATDLVDEPLLFVGDIQGCLESLIHLTMDMELENQRRVEQGLLERTLVFVGDISDRGPYDAEAARYICNLVHEGRAILVKGNHDHNLLKALEGGEVGSKETRETAEQLLSTVSEGELLIIKDVIRKAPTLARWQGVAAGHASVPYLPRENETFEAYHQKFTTFGARSGRFIGGRAAVYQLEASVAHDPNVLVMGGHTHSGKPAVHHTSGTVNLDGSVEQTGTLLGMRYPELEFVSGVEPEVAKFHQLLLEESLPSGETLLQLLDFCDRLSMIERKSGSGEYEGLTIVTYSRITDLGNLWERFPVLRNFRGLIVDDRGEIVARPFAKTHKANIEIPLESLTVVPDRVVEKANGSLIIAYHWQGKWHTATKFSFENEMYTAQADELLQDMDLTAPEPGQTYLFEIILPEDPHIVDYHGQRDLVLLGAINNRTTESPDYHEVEALAASMGCRTAEDMTKEFDGMTIADIYKAAQTPGVLTNLEGLMALYEDEHGTIQTVKIKALEYDDKKFVRDKLNWDKLIDAYDPELGDIPHKQREDFLLRHPERSFVREVLGERIRWIRDSHSDLEKHLMEDLGTLIEVAEIHKAQMESEGLSRQQAIKITMSTVAKRLKEHLANNPSLDFPLDFKGAMGLIRGVVAEDSRLNSRLEEAIIKCMKARIAEEVARRGKCAYWAVPQND